MSITTLALSALLGAEPQPNYTPDLASLIDRTDVQVSEVAATVVSYDVSGEIVASIEAWENGDGDLVIFADFPDGFAEYTVGIADRSFAVESDLDAPVISRRVGAMVDTLEIGGFTTGPQEGVLGCGVSILATAVATAAANPYGATLGGIATVCNCTPLIFKKAKCPEIW